MLVAEGDLSDRIARLTGSVEGLNLSLYLLHALRWLAFCGLGFGRSTGAMTV